MSQHPIQGVPLSKPRLPKIEGNGQPSNKAEMQRLSREYLTHRNRQMEAKAFLAETEAAHRRGKLLDKERIARQIADVFVALRQAILNFAPRYASRMVGLPDEHAARQLLVEASHEFLTALSELSAEKIFQREEDEGEKPLRPANAQQIAAEEAKVRLRKAKKRETMRELRAPGRIKDAR
jgi:hypothetical protein